MPIATGFVGWGAAAMAGAEPNRTPKAQVTAAHFMPRSSSPLTSPRQPLARAESSSTRELRGNYGDAALNFDAEGRVGGVSDAAQSNFALQKARALGEPRAVTSRSIHRR